jgi:DnaK suppressor protein
MKQQALELNQIKSLEKLLQEQRDEILSNGKTLIVDFSTSEDDLSDEVDLALSDIEQGMKMRLGTREALYFKKVEEALLRIQENEYGQCLDCNAQIGYRRLLARPTAELCIDCKETAERNETLNAEGRKHKSVGQTISFK